MLLLVSSWFLLAVLAGRLCGSYWSAYGFFCLPCPILFVIAASIIGPQTPLDFGRCDGYGLIYRNYILPIFLAGLNLSTCFVVPTGLLMVSSACLVQYCLLLLLSSIGPDAFGFWNMCVMDQWAVGFGCEFKLRWGTIEILTEVYINSSWFLLVVPAGRLCGSYWSAYGFFCLPCPILFVIAASIIVNCFSQYTVLVDNLIQRIHFHRIRRIQLSVQYSVFVQKINTTYSLLLNTAYRSSDTCMTRSSTSELFTPYKEPERNSTIKRHFKTLSLDEKLRSPDFNLFFDQEYSEEEVAETMAETMEQYMSKTRTILDSRGAIPSKTAADAKTAIQEMAAYSQKWHNGTSRTRRSIRLLIFENFKSGNEQGKKGSYGPQFLEAYSEASHINNSIPRKEKDPGRASVSVMPLSTYLNLGLGELAHTKLTVELADRTVKYPKGIAENVLVGIGKFVFPVDFIILDMPEDIKVPLILGRPFLSTARAKIDVYKRKITLRVGEERIVFTSVKPASSLIKRVYMLSLRERMKLDLEARLMGETLVINRSLDPFFEDYIELNDLNEPFELRRNQENDLMPTIEEGEVIEEFRTRDDELDAEIDDYPNYCDYDKKIHIDYV
ncbi:putative reverse transcriptase domain-containing protein [Tanacetum coccineum]